MKYNPWLAFLPALCSAFLAGPAVANAGPDSELRQAGALYDQGDYNNAYKQYVKIAKGGDTFAQYRASYMLLMGLGTSANIVEALAWAVVAAEHDDADLDTYQSEVAALVPGDLRKKAQKKADYYLRRWGESDAKGPTTLAGMSGGSCTGSRLASNCGMSSRGTAAWIGWGADKSGDPQQRARVEELNQAIVKSASAAGLGPTGS